MFDWIQSPLKTALDIHIIQRSIMQQIYGFIRYNNEAIPVMVGKDGIPYFLDSVSNTEVYLEGDIPPLTCSPLYRIESLSRRTT